MTRPDDTGREEVYAAELAAFDGTDLEAAVPFDDLVVLAGVLTTSRWWPAGRQVVVRRARRDARSSTTRWHAGATVAVADAQATPATLVHELAHVLAGPEAGHGPVFRRAHVDLAVVAFGGDRGGWLADAYADVGLTLGARRWAAPPAGAAGPIAL